VLQAAERAAARGKEMAKEAEVRMAERLRERGVQTPPPGDALMAELRAIGETLTQEWAQRAGPEGQQMLERYRAALR
jgi:TRAP-type C4-dicarboxylate transport system substrate-binding protein